eukprot:710143-Pelagomonas_calceolata.AAC.3
MEWVCSWSINAWNVCKKWAEALCGEACLLQHTRHDFPQMCPLLQTYQASCGKEQCFTGGEERNSQLQALLWWRASIHRKLYDMSVESEQRRFFVKCGLPTEGAMMTANCVQYSCGMFVCGNWAEATPEQHHGRGLSCMQERE